MLSKKSRHTRSLANFGSRYRIVTVLRRRFGRNLVISGCTVDEAIQVVKGRSVTFYIYILSRVPRRSHSQVQPEVGCHKATGSGFLTYSQEIRIPASARRSTEIFIIINHF
jgi:hypothetical protein